MYSSVNNLVALATFSFGVVDFGSDVHNVRTRHVRRAAAKGIVCIHAGRSVIFIFIPIRSCLATRKDKNKTKNPDYTYDCKYRIHD